MASHELRAIDTLVNKAVNFIHESTTFMEQLRCFVCCYVFLTQYTLSSAFIFWLLYFSLTIVSTFLRDDLNISSDGWKEKCTLKKFGIVLAGIIVENFGYEIEDLFVDFRDIVERKAPRLLGLYDRVVTPAVSDAGKLPAVVTEKMNKTDEVYATKCLLKKSRDMETDLKMRNNYLSNKLSASKSECSQLRDSQIEAFAQIDQLRAKLEFEKNKSAYLQRVLQDKESDTSKEIFELNQTIIKFEFGERWFIARLSEYAAKITAKEEMEFEMNELKEANESLEAEKELMLMKLRKANETTEFYMKLLDLEYCIV